MTESRNPLGTRTTLETDEGTAHLYSLDALEKAGLGKISTLPVSIKILLESVVRNCDGTIITEDDIKALAGWNAPRSSGLWMDSSVPEIFNHRITT